MSGCMDRKKRKERYRNLSFETGIQSLQFNINITVVKLRLSKKIFFKRVCLWKAEKPWGIRLNITGKVAGDRVNYSQPKPTRIAGYA